MYAKWVRSLLLTHPCNIDRLNPCARHSAPRGTPACFHRDNADQTHQRQHRKNRKAEREITGEFFRETESLGKKVTAHTTRRADQARYGADLLTETQRYQLKYRTVAHAKP